MKTIDFLRKNYSWLPVSEDNIQLVPVLDSAGCSLSSHEKFPNSENREKRTLEDSDTSSSNRPKNSGSQTVCSTP